jgi:hypothetical protein
MSHQSRECPAVRETGKHSFAAWTTEPPVPDGIQVQRLMRRCIECAFQEWEDDPGDDQDSQA